VISVAELLDGAGWDVCDPRIGPRQLATWITVLLASTEQITIEDAMRRVFALPLDELVATLG